MNKNLNDIIPPSRRRTMEGTSSNEFLAPEAPQPPMPPRPQYSRPSPIGPRRRFPIGTALVALVVVAASAGALYLFSGAKVTVTPATNEAFVSGEFVATLSGGDLPFEIVSVEKVGSASVPSEGTENVNQPAQGTITIMNKQEAPQQLIKNTRFETPNGLIFRIRDSVTVPAARGTTPGTLETTVYADAGGDSYNVGPTTFTLPGLAGSAAFTQVTAASSEPMKGGFSGPRPTVSEETREAKMAELRAALAPQVEAELAESIPEGYILVPGASAVTYESQPDQGGATGSVEISEKASARAIIFPTEALARAIAQQTVGAYSGQPVMLKDAATLRFAPVGDLPQAGGAQELAFSLAGDTTIIWKVDPARIAAAVAGKTRESAQVVLSGYPEVDRASLVLRPFWSSSFPQDPEKIDVVVESGS